jgi:hypothetical protein
MSEMGLDAEDEELQLEYEEACNEVVDLERELRAAKLQAQQLRLRLQAVGVKAKDITGAQNVPVVMPEVERKIVDRRRQGIRDVFQWVADHACLSEIDFLTVDCEVPMGERLVQLREVAQWSLPSAPGKRLKVTVLSSTRKK